MMIAITCLVASCGSKQNKAADGSADSTNVNVAENSTTVKLTVENVFMILPDSVATPMRLTTDKRAKVLKKEAIKDAFYGDEGLTLGIETDNNDTYMTVSGPWEGTWEMRVWTLTDGSQIAIVNSVACGPQCEQIYFYTYRIDKSGKTLAAVVLPAPKRDYKFSDFTSEKLAPSKIDEIEKDMSIAIYRRLPRTGEDISVVLDETWLADYDMSADILHECILRWNGKVFE